MIQQGAKLIFAASFGRREFSVTTWLRNIRT